MKQVRIGIAGVGNMGSVHARNILDGNVDRLVLAALSDRNEERLRAFPKVPGFATLEDMVAAGGLDAVIVSTPHYHHVPMAIKVLKAGLHVMVEKPIAVHKADAERLLAAAKNRRRQVFAAMFNQRTDAYYQTLRSLVHGGELGKIRRINWIITDWYRTETYYSSSDWRATWAGEGGGVLLNQCPHNLDLLQWIFGMPKRVRAFCGFGRYHNIEVEDDVTAFLEFSGGTTGLLVTTTGEAPGTNRLEIAAERGRVVYENDRLLFTRNAVEMSPFSRTSDEAFGRPATEEIEIKAASHGEQHNGILRNFVNAILEGEALLSPAREGIRSVELANAMLLSAWTNKTVELPLSSAAYARRLNEKIKHSRPKRRKQAKRASGDDFARSFGT